MDRGRLLRGASQATAEMANTTRPSSTHGEVAALIASEPPDSLARSVATVMPCLSSTWPTAADPTAKSSSTRLMADNLGLLTPSGALDNEGLLGMRSHPQDELVAEERRPRPDQALVDLTHRPQLATVRLRHHAEREPGGPVLEDVVPARADQPAQRRAGEEAQVRLVQDAAPVIAEQPERGPGPRVPVPEVGHRQQNLAARPQHPQDLPQGLRRPGQMLDDVPGDDQVVASAHLGRDAQGEVGPDEVVGALPDAGDLQVVHAGDVMPEGPDALREQTAGATDVQDLRRLHAGHHLQHHRVR